MSDITVETSSHLTNSLTRENASHGTEELLGHLNIAVTRSVEINANARSWSCYQKIKRSYSLPAIGTLFLECLDLRRAKV